jgi:DNA polymerase-1
MKYVEIDFEFRNSKNPILDLVCCSLTLIGEDKERGNPVEYWLFQEDFEKDCLKSLLIHLHEQGYTFIAHQVVAEARSFIALGLDPVEFRWLDTHIEWRQATNHHKKFRYGKHLIKGKVKNLIPPQFDKWRDDDSQDRLKHGLAEMVFKLLDIRIDIEEKDEVRDIIIHGTDEQIIANKERIQAYCTSDIQYLFTCLSIISREVGSILKKNPIPNMLERGTQQALVSWMEERGYPIDVEATLNFSRQVPRTIKDIQEDINSQFPDMGVFTLDKKTRKYTRKEKPIREWIDNSPYADQWPRTDTDKYSLSQKAFSKFFNYRHEYPRNNFGAQKLRYLKVLQSLNGFKPSKEGSFWDYVGKDGRVRAYLNPYGSQSGRFQPGATGFLFLKSAWMRSLAVPPKGYAIAGIDYKSEEYLIAAIESKDQAMIDSYMTGDVYNAYAIASGLSPKGATKKSHPKERDISKPVVLGINYDMSKWGLAIDMTEKLGREVSPDEAQDYIDAFFNEYYKFAEYKEQVQTDYELKGYLTSPNGWVMFGDNHNFRSVGNFPIQSAGSAILLKAIELCHKAGLKVIIPLHDALYIEYKIQDQEESLEKFEKCMIDAFNYFYPDSGIMLDAETWSSEFEVGSLSLKSGLKVKVEKIHIDERAESEYHKFKQYFSKPDSDLL